MSLKICDGKSVEEFEKCRTCKIISAKEMHFQVHFCGVGLRDDDDEIEEEKVLLISFARGGFRLVLVEQHLTIMR